MLQIVCLVESQDSFSRFKNGIVDVEFEDYIKDLEELQSNIILTEYDIAIIDKRLWWWDQAADLLKKRGTEIVYFKGEYEEIIKFVQERNFPEPSFEEDLNNTTNKGKREKRETEVQYIYKNVEVPVEKIVYRSRNIKQNIVSIISTDDMSMRDSVACNISALVTEDEKRTLLVDLTIFSNIINHLDIEEFSKSDIFEIENFNANTILECVDKVRKYKNFHVLRVNNSSNLTKKNIKNIIYNARDYDNIVFVLESDLHSMTTKFVLNSSHKIFIVTAPLLLSVKNIKTIVDKLYDAGQINENIKIVLAGNDVLNNDDIQYLYSGFEITFLNRKMHLNEINDRKLISNRKELESYQKLLGLKQEKKFFFKKK